MARTPLLSRIEAAAQQIAEPSAQQDGLTRRRFLRDSARLAAASAAATTTAGWLAPLTRAAAGQPTVAIVGAGLAGLTCAYRLRQAGIVATVHEASNRLGGRCWTGRGAFADGQIFEHGGELIDTGHLEIKQLAQALGLKLDNLVQAEARGTELLGYFDGVPYTARQMSADLKVIWRQLHRDLSQASYPTLYNLSTPRGRELDQMSIRDWLQAYVPGGTNSRLGQILDVAYTIEYGAEIDDQSSLNLLYLLGYAGPGQFRMFGKSNEKLHIRGGNDQLVDRLAAALPGQVTTGSELVEIRRNPSGTFALMFRQGTVTVSATVDHVVLALPFTVLRSSVDWSLAGFSARKATAINEQGMGRNSKLHVQFSDRFWNDLGSNGETFSDRGYQNTWDVSRAQAGASGLLVNYTGGNYATTFGSGTPASLAGRFLDQVEPVLPGATDNWNGLATVDDWQANPWTRGSYSYWKVGQYTQFAGVEGEREGNCHFAGEHTSIDFIGYLNGAVETGERAAAEILDDLR